MDRPDWAPETIDIERPSAARMYDYYLGGSHNFAVDREAARRMIDIVPDTPLRAQASRSFLRRAVRHLVEHAGMRQFLDIGAGIPTVGNAHEIAQRYAPGSRVVYVDIDPVAVAHSLEILAGNADATAVRADLRRPKEILDHDGVRRLINFSEPVAVMIVSVLHFVSDSDEPAAIIDTLRRSLTRGSHLVLSTAAREHADLGRLAGTRQIYQQAATTLTLRSRAAIEAFFDGFDLLPPGLVPVTEWRPDSPLELFGLDHRAMLGGVGRLRD